MERVRIGLVGLGKIALDIMIMASTEYAEVYEPFVKGRGASSTMPQKRNPISSELMLAAAKAVRQHAGLMVDAMNAHLGLPPSGLAGMQAASGQHPGGEHEHGRHPDVVVAASDAVVEA